jgi:hypothetical protein
LSTDTGVLALYAGNGTSPTVSQSPFGTNMPTLGTSFTPGGAGLVLQGIGNTAGSANVLVYDGGTVYGGTTPVGALTAATNYTMVMDITRVAGATPTYTFATTLNAATLNDTLSITGLGSINQVGLRWFNPNAPSPDFSTPTIISIDSFSASIIPEPATSALVFSAVACGLVMGRRKRVAFEQ